MNIWEWIDKLTKGLQKLDIRITSIESVLFDDKTDTRNPIVTKEQLEKINDRLDEIERKLGGSDGTSEP
ncbi:hypothetical protein [Ligilactobacillus salivarius]|uniref:hypothetical protein n=1 Tax=Ligilactobacillus salivarius TaxID=1624 RepID=UPI000BAF4ECA|nr:hypothetical protein [Ligilactobacillus salivarius]PAY33491.1 hypothetical protein A8C54_01910 [Ligilactobacillus salivarius]PAY41946.1 hypothetical protein A8C34_04195 [Ligilactobacillus salivarius]PAY43978.1 hypothetical protein A8C55_10480 [Ligilactobacillus salivarius]UXI84013.1 hypothetical protein NYZ94_08455 [Ligilactobacillus salivarius]